MGEEENGKTADVVLRNTLAAYLAAPRMEMKFVKLGDVLVALRLTGADVDGLSAEYRSLLIEFIAARFSSPERLGAVLARAWVLWAKIAELIPPDVFAAASGRGIPGFNAKDIMGTGEGEGSE